jgi:UDP-N-acetylmuramoyl-tripeptide--D-alanyl-D-alanine ligase
VARSGAEVFVAVGPLSRDAADAARRAGMKEVRHFEDATAAGAFLAPFLGAEDLVLVKGSRAMTMERIIEAIRSLHGKEEA